MFTVAFTEMLDKKSKVYIFIFLYFLHVWKCSVLQSFSAYIIGPFVLEFAVFCMNSDFLKFFRSIVLHLHKPPLSHTEQCLKILVVTVKSLNNNNKN